MLGRGARAPEARGEIVMLGMLKSLFGRRGAQASPQEAVACLNRGAILVDMREQGEFARGHVQGALNIPLGELRAGGLGTHLMSKIMDRVEYTRPNNRNQVRLVKYRSTVRTEGDK